MNNITDYIRRNRIEQDIKCNSLSITKVEACIKFKTGLQGIKRTTYPYFSSHSCQNWEWACTTSIVRSLYKQERASCQYRLSLGVHNIVEPFILVKGVREQCAPMTHNQCVYLTWTMESTCSHTFCCGQNPNGDLTIVH